MNGFGTIQSRDINEIVAGIEKQIKTLKSDFGKDVVVLQNRLESCVYELNVLKEKLQYVQDYNETEYGKIQAKIAQFDEDIAYIKDHLNTITYNETVGGKCASGINYFPIYSRYTEKDISGRDIIPTYATKEELSSVSGSSMSALSSVSSTLNTAISTETERSTSAENDIRTNLSNNIVRIENEITDQGNELGQLIANEEQARASADTTLQTNIENEVNRATDSEQFITDNLTGEITRSMGVDNEISTTLTNEITRSTNRDDLLQQNINALSNSVNDKESALNTKIEEETTRATTKENELASYISTETNNRINAVEDLQTQINAEVSSRIVEINSVVSAINAEEERALSAESGLDSKIDSSVNTINNSISALNDTFSQALEQEISARTNADTTLQTNINNEVSARMEAVSALQTSLDTETSARTTADTLLQQQINTIEATQNVVDIVGTKADLDVYDTSKLKDGVKIQVLQDESQNDATTIYQFDKYAVPNPIFVLVGSLGSYYTKSQTDNLLSGKQNNLSAGDGIAIANDVVSHSIKIIENNNQEDTVEGTVFTVYLKNNHYKLITFDKTITEIIFMIEKSATSILQETGFEFQVPEDSDLETLTFKVVNDENKKIYTIIPDSYISPNIYQGTIVNYRCTIGEYEVED